MAFSASAIFLLVPGVNGGTCDGMSATNERNYKHMMKMFDEFRSWKPLPTEASHMCAGHIIVGTQVCEQS